MPVELVLFVLMLAGVALLHGRALQVAVAGLVAITAWKLAFAGFPDGPGWAGLARHLAHEWVVLANLFMLLTGFALLARHFEASRLPALLPAVLPDGWTGGLALLALVFLLSAFLDNIAAALIGASTAATVYRRRLHVGFLAAIVAASNAGGAGSVIGDTTTTMMWIQGVAPAQVVDAYLASLAAFAVFAVPAARLQQAHAPIVREAPPDVGADWPRLFVVVLVLLLAVGVNLAVSLSGAGEDPRFPWLGATVWLTLLAAAPWRAPEWFALPGAARGSLFLLCLVTAASMMPVERLPAASPASTLGLGVVSAFFDNIPLTSLALAQGGYDWGLVAYAVGFGGSMLWFGSSAGVAVASQFPQARSTLGWLRYGWPVVLAYPVGYLVLLALHGWHPAAR